jgi:hypothetical protein
VLTQRYQCWLVRDSLLTAFCVEILWKLFDAPRATIPVVDDDSVYLRTFGQIMNAMGFRAE